MGAAPKAFGIDQAHVWPLLSDESGSGAPVYGDGKWIPELTKLGVKIQNEVTKFNSDNHVSEVFVKTSGAQLSVNVGGLSMESHAAVLGMDAPADNEPGRLDDLAVQPGPVAIAYRRKMSGKTSDGRQRYRYVVIYRVQFAPPDDETETEGDKGVTVQPDSLSGEALALDSYLPEHQYWRYVYDNWLPGASQALDDAFFDTVQGIATLPAIAIAGQPESVTVEQGAITGALAVAATTTVGTLTYQWYRSAENSSESGALVSGATAAEMPIPTDLTTGTYYYYCMVGVAGRSVRKKSNVAVVLVQ